MGLRTPIIGEPLPWPLGPVAHRGLHDAGAGVIENTASAFEAAIEAGYAIETDIQAAFGDEPVVFHDDTLERLTQGQGAVAALSPDALGAVPFKATGDRILGLPAFLELVGARVPVYLEIKSHGDRANRELERRIGLALAAYRGPVAVMSFDPGALRAMRRIAPDRPRGTVSTRYTREDWPEHSPLARFRLTHLLDFPATRPDFLAYHIDDLPRLQISALRRLGLPVLTWTVRTREQQRRAAIYADAIIFEGLRP
jgi:glycerophosphoryl diester phosphodiesterase